MKCSRAQELISLSVDGYLSIKEQRSLDQHLRKCQDCLSFHRELNALTDALAEDSNIVEDQGVMSQSFSHRMHDALIEEQRRISKEPAIIIEQFLRRVFTFRTSKFLGLVRITAVTALIMVVAAYSLFILLDAPAELKVDHCFGHFAAFNAHTASDGRVYANLDEQGSTGHLVGNRGDQK